MGNLIKDFWTYKYHDNRYYGVIEVVSGDLRYRRVENKFETRIERALAYLDGKKVLSHMSVQSYNDYLNKGDRASRTADEEAFYPFFLEFEPHVKPGQANFYVEYKKAVSEAYRTASYLIYEKNVNPEDILVMMTNSRSVYLFINPVIYGLRPSKVLHNVYKKMYEELDESIGFKYVDTSLFRFNGLVKTPGAYYAGGFVVPISIEELKNLANNPDQEQKKLTRVQRSIDKDIPGAFSRGMEDIYINALEEVDVDMAKRAKKARKRAHGLEDVTFLKNGIACIEHLEKNIVEPGQRNFALVGLAIAYKNAGYSKEQTEYAVQCAADRWNHDEDERIIVSKVKSVYEKDYNFSCSYLKEHVDLCGSCKKCKLNKDVNKAPNTKFWVGRQVIDQLKANNASLRHYKAYLVMSRNELYGKYFIPEEYNLDQRVIRELINMTGGTRELQNGLVKATIDHGGKKYLIPNEFIDNGECEALGERLKPYLVLYTHFIYKATNKYGMMRIKVETIAATLGYKSMSSVYKLIQDLQKSGMAVFRKGYLFSLYFSSYKIVSIDEYKHIKEEKEGFKGKENELKTGTNDGGESRLFWKLSRGSP